MNFYGFNIPIRMLILLITLTVVSPVSAQDYCSVVFRSLERINSMPTRSPIELLATIKQRTKYEHDIMSYHLMDDAVPPALADGPVFLNQLRKFGVKTNEEVKHSREFPTLPLLHDLNISEIQRLSTDAIYRKEFAKLIYENTYGWEFDKAIYEKGFESHFRRKEKTEEAVEQELSTAVDFLVSIKKTSEFPERKALTKREFREIAKTEKLKVQIFPFLYRFDSRSYKEIAADKGFFPNPTKPRTAISAHAIPTSDGGKFVSLTKEADNVIPVTTAKIGYVAREVHQSKETNKIKKQLLEKAEGFATHAEEKPKLYVLYEYQLVNVLGVEPPAHASIAIEKEVIAPYVEASKITAVRPVYVLRGPKNAKNYRDEIVGVRNDSILGVQQGEWLPVTPDQHAQEVRDPQ